ncbi:hypothetical protein PVAND_015401 [Polypedilum vanderplanki]|uniref:Uncharacterized protein n=1 Tax=Polypedilum vanderplanki TaxID=319348 RepID=A0A9J6BCH9_POLVA|nr:hypothetical protein PVAND_015401 [Polypedilum vanderplanki]
MRSSMIFVIFAIFIAFSMGNPVDDKVSYVSIATSDNLKAAACSQPACFNACYAQYGNLLVSAFCQVLEKKMRSTVKFVIFVIFITFIMANPVEKESETFEDFMLLNNVPNNMTCTELMENFICLNLCLELYHIDMIVSVGCRGYNCWCSHYV